MDYALEISPAAARDIRRLPPSVQDRIEIAVNSLATKPRPPGARKLVNWETTYRLRVGSYRVIYLVNDPQRRVAIDRILPRAETTYRRP